VVSPSLANHPLAADPRYELLGPIVRLQVQIAHLKQGEKPHRWYEPAPITSVPHMRIETGGVVGLEGAREIGDVHHRDHDISRNRGDNGISIGFTSHYVLMRNQFGSHLADGIAGENILVASERTFTPEELIAGVAIATADGVVPIDEVRVAPPCVEFSKFCLQYPPERTADRDVATALRFLHQGTRGFYATYTLADDVDTPTIIATGDLLYRRLP